MTVTQLDFESIGHPTLHEADKARADEAILADGYEHGGWINPNRVREVVSNEYGINVHPQTLSNRYGVLARQGLIYRPEEGTPEAQGWPRVVNNDRRSRNSGRSRLAYRVVVPGQHLTAVPE